MKNFDSSINIRSIQQFLYCPHRWGLMEIECDWSENFFVTKGNLVHEKANSGIRSRFGSCITERSVEVYNDEWNIFGVIDVLELYASKSGTYIKQYDGVFKISIVEYKASAPKDVEYHREDAMQVLAQKICVDTLFKTDTDTFFYYANTKKRVKVAFSEDDYSFLHKTLLEMVAYMQKNTIPKIEKNQYCGGCSLADVCFPKIFQLDGLI